MLQLTPLLNFTPYYLKKKKQLKILSQKYRNNKALMCEEGSTPRPTLCHSYYRPISSHLLCPVSSS